MKKLLVNAFLVFGIAFSVKPAWAILIEFQPAAQMVEVGDSLDVGIVVSGLAPDSLSTFDIDVGFDATILAFNSATFGDELDLFGFGSDTLATPGAGTVNLFELSSDFPGAFDSLQADSFILATLTFEALAVGTSSLLLSINALGDALGDPLGADVGVGSITAVPEPAALLLMAVGLAAFVGLRRWALPTS